MSAFELRHSVAAIVVFRFVAGFSLVFIEALFIICFAASSNMLAAAFSIVFVLRPSSLQGMFQTVGFLRRSWSLAWHLCIGIAAQSDLVGSL